MEIFLQHGRNPFLTYMFILYTNKFVVMLSPVKYFTFFPSVSTILFLYYTRVSSFKKLSFSLSTVIHGFKTGKYAEGSRYWSIELKQFLDIWLFLNDAAVYSMGTQFHNSSCVVKMSEWNSNRSTWSDSIWECNMLSQLPVKCICFLILQWL